MSATRVLQFTELTADARIEKRTGFPEGTEVLYIQRLRILDGKPLILDHNYFLRELMPELTPQIAEGSVYEYLELCLAGVFHFFGKVGAEHDGQVNPSASEEGIDCRPVVGAGREGEVAAGGDAFPDLSGHFVF